MDVFQKLPTEIRRNILENLDFPSLYNAIRAYLSLAKTFNAFPANILEAGTRRYPRQVQQCVRMTAALSSNWTAGMSFERFEFCYLHGPAKDRSFPFMGISAAEAHDVLKRAWRVHWTVRHWLDVMIQRLVTHYGKSLDTVKLPAFPSWVEEQRVLRAVWRLHVCMMVGSEDRFWPNGERFDFYQSIPIWGHIPKFETAELAIVVKYARRIVDQPGVDCPRNWAEMLENGLFNDKMVQPSWRVARLVESAEDWFSGREESHLRMPGRGSKVSGSGGGPFFGLYSGRDIWDKDRLRRVGLDVCAWSCRLEHWHEDKRG